MTGLPDASAPAAPPARPDGRFTWSHPAHAIALAFGAGLSRWAPGTVGTLWAWAAFLLLGHWLPAGAMGWVIAASLPVGWWACTLTARHMNVADPSSVVWDEVVAFWIVLWLVLPAGFWTQAAAFGLFRFFDAAKPGPVGWADRLCKRPAGAAPHEGWGWAGVGILFDDLVAAFCTLLAIALWRFFF
ncbi:MAG: phosphatidylglycerophosphatase A [Xenophilus sp.]